jgi:predicted ATP-grasp superfamily ATP-dependent carboligase
MSSITRKAIIFNCHYNGLSIIQELGQNGIECIAMDTVRSIGTFSKYARYQKCPNPMNEENIFIEYLYNICSKEKEPPVLFPTNDHWAIALSKHKEKLVEVAIPCVADWETVNTVIDKELFYKMGKENDYLTPQIYSTADLSNISAEDFPIVAKPKYRRTSSNENTESLCENLDRLRYIIIRNKNEMDYFINSEKRYLPYLIFQEYIPGMSDNMYTVGIYADSKSNILGLFTGHKVRGYPADSGDCIVGENYNLPDYVINNSYRIVNDIKYTGIAEFEYKKDSNTGEFRLIEINPRSWSWIGITSGCGVNLPFIAYSDLTGKQVKYIRSVLGNGSVKYMKVLDDLKNSLISYKNDYPYWSKTLKQWYEEFRSSKVIIAEFNAGDWPIGIRALINFTIKELKIFMSI